MESSVKRIGGSLFVRVPAEDARRLGLQDNARVELDVRPLGRSVEDVLKNMGRFRRLARDDDLWGSD